MIEKVNIESLSYIQDILRKEFYVYYESNAFSKEFVYIEEEKIVGFIIYSIIYDRIELDYIYVCETKRNVGIASKLMLYMIEDSSNNNVKNITLEVNVNNKSAIALYKKHGFIIAATRNGYYNGEDGYLMIRE